MTDIVIGCLRAWSFLLMAFCAGAAHAGPWEVFEQRCLIPMAEMGEPDLKGLILMDPEPGFLVWQTREGWSIRTANGLDAPQVCLLSGFEWDEAVQDETFSWIEKALAEERFELQQKVSLQSPTILHSTFWREPKIELSYQPFDLELGSYLSVRETDLES